MTDLSIQPAGQVAARRTLTPILSRLALLACLAIGAGLAWASVSPASSAGAVEAAGADLTRLLRGMAAIKALICLAILAGVSWRLAAPVSALGLSGYGTMAFAMGAGLVLTWSMVSLALGAVLLHVGLLGALVLLARDRAVGHRLNRLLLRR